MAEQIIDVGTAPNNGTGDPLRTAFIKTDNNFDQIWAAGPVGSNVRIQNNVVSTLQVNQDLALSPNGVGNVRLNNNTIPGANNTWFLGSTTNQWRGVYANSITAGNVTINNNLVVPGDVTIEGNLTVEGDTIQIGNIVTDTKTIQLSNTASTANAATGSGITVGANDNIATLLYNSASNVWTTNIGVTATGNITAPYFVGNGALLTGITSYSNTNATSLLASFGSNTISTTGNITAGYFIGNGSQLTGITSYANANAVAYGEAGWAGNIIPSGNAVYSLGNATNQWNDLYVSNTTIFMNNVPITLGADNVLTVNGNAVLSNNSNTAVSTTGNITAGNVLTGGTVSATGNITANYFVGNGSQLTGIVSSYGNANVANYLPTFSGNISAGNVSATGNISGAYIKGNGSELTNLPAPTVTQDISSTGDMSIMTYDGVIKSVNYATVEPSSGNIKGGNIFTLGNVTGGNINSPTLNNSGNISVVAGGNTWTFGTDGKLINLDGLTLTAGGQFNICTILTGGSGYDTGSALKATTGGSGSGMTVAIGYGLSNQLTNADVVDPGTGYVDGDVITVSGGTGGTFVITRYNEQANQANNNFIESNWVFENAGNLTLPGNTFAVNYANGTPVSIGGGGNTGNVTFNDVNIIGTGNLKLQPDPANASAYLDIYLTAGPDIHIAGNGETVILGTDDFANVTVNVDGNVSIQASNGTPHTWTFDTAGNLTLPNNIISNTTIDIDNRASGNSADIQLFAADDIKLQARDRFAGSTSEGGDINIFAGDSAEDGDSSGGDIQILAGDGGAANVDFGGPGGFITIQSGQGGEAIGNSGYSAESGGALTLNAGDAGSNNGNIDLGADGGNVYIGAGDSTGNGVNGGTIYLTSGAADASALAGDVVIQAGGTWTFDNAGNLALPQGGVVYETNIPDGGLNGQTIALKPQGGTDADQQLLIYPTVNDANHLHLTSGNLYNTELYLGNDDFYVKLANTGDIIVNTAGNTAQWTFGTDGLLTFPTGNLVITPDDPAGNIASIVSTDHPLGILSTGANGAVSSLWVEDIGNVGTSNIAAVYANPTPGSKIVRIAVGQNGVGGGPNLWDFDAAGNLTVPGNIIMTTGIVGSGASPAPSLSGFSSVSAVTLSASGNVTAGNVSATGNVTAANFFGNGNTLSNVATTFESTWTVPTGNSTQSFTVTPNNTYYLWVDCNIANGILAWNATATITNTNVPVVGAQYAWVYNGGGTPIDFTSIPDQFVGTANTIVRSSVAPSATTNRFDFGINNASGNTVTVNYGYTKIS